VKIPTGLFFAPGGFFQKVIRQKVLPWGQQFGRHKKGHLLMRAAGRPMEPTPQVFEEELLGF
jgi:hypothetical protein